MFIFLTIVMGPGFGFMLYALFQFWREEWRMRHAHSRWLSGVVNFVTAVDPPYEHTPHHATDAPAAPAVSESEPAIVSFAAGETPERAKVVTTCLKNRLAVMPSGTGRLAVKRAAKG